jgi:hypothetical protein
VLTNREADTGDSGAISISFLHLSLFPFGRRSVVHPGATFEGRWSALALLQHRGSRKSPLPFQLKSFGFVEIKIAGTNKEGFLQSLYNYSGENMAESCWICKQKSPANTGDFYVSIHDRY